MTMSSSRPTIVPRTTLPSSLARAAQGLVEHRREIVERRTRLDGLSGFLHSGSNEGAAGVATDAARPMGRG